MGKMRPVEQKKIGGLNACSCDQRYRPRIVQLPNAYYVVCPNCGLRTPQVDRFPYASHSTAMRQAKDHWNMGKFLS
jgi:methionine synthase I (cobalamin-dependent)